MAAPVVTMQQLIEAGAHFGHQTHRWNPRMKPYIFGARNGVHILDLSQTVPLFARALDFVDATVQPAARCCSSAPSARRRSRSPRPRALRPALRQPPLAGRHAHQLEDHLQSIKRLKALEEQLAGDTAGLTKKEVLQLTRERDKLELSLGGIRDMGGIPDVMFVIDANKEELAIKEANVLGIPVVAILDSNVSIPMASPSRSRPTTTPAAPSALLRGRGRCRDQGPPRSRGRFGRRCRRAGRAGPEAGRGRSRLPKKPRPKPELSSQTCSAPGPVVPAAQYISKKDKSHGLYRH
jgi:small subunit ribosomal protein S2